MAPLNGTCVDDTAVATPGTDPISRVSWSWNAAFRSAGSASDARSMNEITSVPSGSKPIGTAARLRNVCTKSSAEKTSTSDSAICATTSPRWSRARWRSTVVPRAPWRMTVLGSTSETRSAGSSPKRTAVSVAVAPTNAISRQLPPS